jgi:DNA adenine methylase
MLKCKPFVKWAGGKRSIIEDIKKLIPDSYNTYYEPFVGGGAVLYELAPKKAVINDYNKELINVYNCIKNDEKFEKMCRELDKHEVNHSEEHYYEIRSLDKDSKSYNKLPDYIRAARTIYLNKSCFNGLYRVNRNNEFNVPFGKKVKINTYDAINLTLIYAFLNTNEIKILNTDYEEAVNSAKKGDFIYFDPPYDSDTSTFTSYTENGFDKEEQKRLATVFSKLAEKGCYVMLSNYNTALIKELYKDFNIHVIKGKTMIGARSKDRKPVDEVLITNY